MRSKAPHHPWLIGYTSSPMAYRLQPAYTPHRSLTLPHSLKRSARAPISSISLLTGSRADNEHLSTAQAMNSSYDVILPFTMLHLFGDSVRIYSPPAIVFPPPRHPFLSQTFIQRRGWNQECCCRGEGRVRSERGNTAKRCSFKTIARNRNHPSVCTDTKYMLCLIRKWKLANIASIKRCQMVAARACDYRMPYHE